MRKTFHLPAPDSLEGVDFPARQQTACSLKTDPNEACWRRKKVRRDAELIWIWVTLVSVRQTEVLQGLVSKVELEPPSAIHSIRHASSRLARKYRKTMESLEMIEWK